MVEAYTLFKVASGTEREVCETIKNFDEVLNVSIIFGEYDVMAKLSVPDLQSLETFLSEKIRKVEKYRCDEGRVEYQVAYADKTVFR